MTSTKVTTHELKKMNRSKVYQFIYDKKETSRPEIVHSLQMSFPTITQNLNDLEAQELIMWNGFQASSGGRKAHLLSCNPIAKIAIGTELLEDEIRIVAVDLYGNVLKETIISQIFSNSPEYFSSICCSINAFINELEIPSSKILGIGIAVQGIVSPDGKTVVYGELLGFTGLSLDYFIDNLDFPCIFIQASKAATYSELGKNKGLSNAVHLSLNQYLGSGLILNGEIYQGANHLGGTFEHMILVPGGRRCYCGNSGCVDAYCSAHYITEEFGGSIEKFFQQLRNGDPSAQKIWDNYLYYLSITISNIRFSVDCDFIIDGLIRTYFTEEDYKKLHTLIKQNLHLPGGNPNIHLGQYGKQAASIGAAFRYIRTFLDSI